MSQLRSNPVSSVPKPSTGADPGGVNVAPLPDEDSIEWRILMAAGPIFADKGFQKATIREICDAANVNLASVNYYFGDKQQLYRQTVIAARHMRASEIPEPDWLAGTTPASRLYEYIRMILKRMVVNQQGPWQVQVLMHEIQYPTDACKELVEDYFRPFVKNLADIVVELANQNIPEPSLNRLVMSVLGQCMIYRFAPETRRMTMGQLFEHEQEDGATSHGQPDRDVELDQLARLITDFSLAGIAAVTATGPKS